MARWVCPTCTNTKLAPGRARRNDTRTYCLRCSERTGRLVRRVVPALDRKRTVKAIAKEERAQALLAKSKTEQLTYPNCLQVEFQKMKRLKIWKRLVRHARLEIRRGSGNYTTGRAWSNSGRIVITAGVDQADARATMLHELAHIATPSTCHGEPFLLMLKDAAEEYLGEGVVIRPEKHTSVWLQGAVRRAVTDHAMVGYWFARWALGKDYVKINPWEKVNSLPLTSALLSL